MEKFCEFGIDFFFFEVFDVIVYVKEIQEEFNDEGDKLNFQDVSFVGCFMGSCVMGKVFFVELQDSIGCIQVYIVWDEICLGEDKDMYNKVFKKLLDIGDYIGVKGYVFCI